MASRVLSSAANVYNRVINSKIGGEGTNYLRDRGIDPHMVTVFNLGVTPSSNMFTKAMLKEGYTEEDLVSSGLAYKTGSGLVEFFSNSIIMPVHNSQGTVHTITSRYFDGSKQKYNNLHNIKNEMFYGQHQIKNRYMYPVKKGMPENYVIVCEGQFDTIMSTQNGYFTLGLLGANNFKETMLSTLSIFSSIILILDNDQAGNRAKEEIAGYIKYEFPWKHIFSVELPDGINDINQLFLEDRDAKLEDMLYEVKTKPKKIRQSKVLTGVREPNSLEERLNSLDLKKIIDKNVALKNGTVNWSPQGRYNYVTKCPFKFHNDQIGSFVLYTKTNSFYCFGCNHGGRAIQFLRYFYKDEGKNENTRA